MPARGKHLFNPSSFGVIAAILTGQAWASAGQWGSGTLLASGLGALGLMTVGKVGRLDISGSFLVAHLGLLASRAAWLGCEPAVVRHQLLDEALILFAFFMISDPRSTPDRDGDRTVLTMANDYQGESRGVRDGGPGPDGPRERADPHRRSAHPRAARRVQRAAAFQETADRRNFQARYVLRHAFPGERACDVAGTRNAYDRQVAERREREAQMPASLTGRDIGEIRGKARLDRPLAGASPWWKRIFD